MKTLFLARHAKSSWDHPELSDFDRPLNKRGKRDAPFMGSLMDELGHNPDLIISSPANRAITTAKHFAEKLNYPVDKILPSKIIYDGDSTDLIDLINQIDDKHQKVFLFGHNPTITSLHNFLCDQYLNNIPTAAVAAIQFDVAAWKEVYTNKGRHLFFEYPKKYFKK